MQFDLNFFGKTPKPIIHHSNDYRPFDDEKTQLTKRKQELERQTSEGHHLSENEKAELKEIDNKLSAIMEKDSRMHDIPKSVSVWDIARQINQENE